MENRTTTFYAVRVIRFYKDGRAPESLWVSPDTNWGRGPRKWRLGSQNDAERFKRARKAKVALGYACVRDELARTRVQDHETAEKVKAKKGKNYYNSPWKHYPTLKVHHEAEVVKITEHVTYDEPQVLHSLPERSPLEQIARQADDCTIYYSLCP